MNDLDKKDHIALNRVSDWHLVLIVTKVWTHKENDKLKHLTQNFSLAYAISVIVVWQNKLYKNNVTKKQIIGHINFI